MSKNIKSYGLLVWVTTGKTHQTSCSYVEQVHLNHIGQLDTRQLYFFHACVKYYIKKKQSTAIT